MEQGENDASGPAHTVEGCTHHPEAAEVRGELICFEQRPDTKARMLAEVWIVEFEPHVGSI